MARLHERSAGKDVIRGKSTSLHGKSEEHGGSPSERVSSSPSPSSSSAMRDYQVNMTVTDKANNRAETFKCSWSTLRVMRYFQDVLPSPAVQAQREEPVSLHASCDVGIFKWLLRWIDHKRPSLTAANVVSIALSSNFLRMHELTDEALLFLRDHLTEVLLSGVDMDCLPGELLGRLSAITPEHVVVNALMELHTSGEGDHANRTFLASMLRHHVSVRLLAKDAEAGAATASSARDDGEASHKAPPTIDHRHDAHPNTSADTSTGCGDSGFPESGLRWCKLCSCLYNVEEMHRSMRAHACAEPTCPGVTNNRMGPRGEVLTTHTPSTRAVLTQPLRSWSRLQVERWALQIIGASRYARCRYCTALVALIDTPAHRCDGMMAGGLSFTPAEEASDAAAKEIWALTRWYGYATQQMIYNAVGGLSPLRYAASSSSVAANQAGATGSILVADCNLRAGTNNSSGNNNNTNSSSRTRSRSRSRTFNTGVPRRHVGGGARPVTGPRSCFWSARPQQVMEVAPFSGAAPDGDVANFYEHDMMHEMEALLTASASVGAPLYRMRLAVHSHQHVTGQSVYEGFGLGSGSNPYNMSGGVGGGGGYGKESMMNGLTTMPKLWRSSSYESGMMASPTSPTAAPFATPSVTDSRLTGYGGQSARARGSKTTSTRRPLPLSTGVGRTKTSVTTSATRTAALSATGSRSTLLNK